MNDCRYCLEDDKINLVKAEFIETIITVSSREIEIQDTYKRE